MTQLRDHTDLQKVRSWEIESISQQMFHPLPAESC